jgi:tetratricopeptide (TPR) repeat protein
VLICLGCGVIFNAAAAILSFSQCAHVGGQLSCAKDLYERAITIISNTKETSELTLASVAMAPEEVHIGALAGLGQLASHLGDFEQAEAKLTEALSQAEHINGEQVLMWAHTLTSSLQTLCLNLILDANAS